jgi:hypothetical protein
MMSLAFLYRNDAGNWFARIITRYGTPSQETTDIPITTEFAARLRAAGLAIRSEESL